ncbi:facilitated trehalose transporter Tret1-like [Diachasmimorpha longicaudata]|uniref:facilitated trehalose transporter Tret1-like n=1 Tax=Diachasmimorpha longicaudata TaxID=58733 RepID=UPI0030B8CD37
MKFPQIHLLDRSSRHQFLAVIVINFATTSTSMFMGWLAPNIPQLLTTDTPVGEEPMSDDEISWLSSIGSLMPLIILPIAAWALERFGRKITGCFMALPITLSWLMALFAQNFWQLLISRILGGVSLALMGAVIPVYIAEISDQSTRGPLGSLFAFSMNLGPLISLIFGATLTYRQAGICGMILPPIFIAIFGFMPESPIYLLRKGKVAEARKSLMWLRSCDKTTVERELSQLQQSLQEIVESTKTPTLKDLFRDRATIKAFIIASGLFIGQHVTGYTIVVTYATLMFKLAKSSLSPNAAAIVIAVIQIFGSWLSTMTINLTGRRSIIMISCVGMGICHLIFGTFFLLMNRNVDVESFSWLPLVALSAYAISYSMGIGPAAYVVATEIFSPDIASLGTSISMMLLWSASFVTAKLFPLISSRYGSYTSFYILVAFCASTCIFTFILVPETKGRSTQSIVEELNGKKTRNDHPNLDEGNCTTKV